MAGTIENPDTNRNAYPLVRNNLSSNIYWPGVGLKHGLIWFCVYNVPFVKLKRYLKINLKQEVGNGKNEDRNKKPSGKVTADPIRKTTKESMVAAKHQRRETCLKCLRESAIRLSNDNNITQMDTLLKDQVINISYLIIFS